MLPVFAALRNHYRIILTYNDALEVFSAGFLGVNCSPPQDCPMEEAPELQGWQQLPGYETQNQLRHNLLKTFFPEALLDSKKLNQNEIARIAALGCEIVDLGAFYRATGLTEPRSPLEEMVLSIEG
jgi:hypothetical protein